MKRILISDTPSLIGQYVKLSGWVNVRRDHGKLIFIDLRDQSGIIQIVVIPDRVEAYQVSENVCKEDVISVEGLVKKRPGGQEKNENPLDRVEIEVEKIEIITHNKN